MEGCVVWKEQLTSDYTIEEDSFLSPSNHLLPPASHGGWLDLMSPSCTTKDIFILFISSCAGFACGIFLVLGLFHLPYQYILLIF